MTASIATQEPESTPANAVAPVVAARVPDAGSRAMLAGLRTQVVAPATPGPPSAPGRESGSSAAKRASNRELLHQAMHAPTEWERSRAAEMLRRQIRTLCAAVVDRYTSALTSQEVDDLAQDVFVRLLTSQADHAEAVFVDPSPAYISRIAVNLIIDRRRFLKRRGLETIPTSVEDEALSATLRDEAPSVEDTVVGRVHAADLRRALARSLSPTEAKVVWMRTEGASHEEIAVALGIKETNARKHLERGIKRLRRLVGTDAIPILA